MFDPETDSLVGRIIGDRYKVTQRLAAGGMGVVYRAERLKLGRTVAIKFLHRTVAARPEALRRFEVEARAMGRLAHPHCVSVIDFGVEEDLPYLVMDFVHGKTLRELLDAGKLPLARALAVFRQVLAGVAHAHGQGIVHRDLKPANIMLTEATGTGDHVRILDFGLAKLGDGSAGETSRALAIGTPSYMAPEQARGEAADARTDVYSLGVLLFEMVVGDKPFFSDQAFEVIQMHATMPAPRLRHRAPPEAQVSQPLEDLVTRAMAKKPEERFQTVAEMAEALARTPEVTGAPRPATLPPEASRVETAPLPSDESQPSVDGEPPPGRSNLWLALLAMLGIAGLGFVVVHLLEKPRPPAPPPPPPVATAPAAAPPPPPPPIDASVPDAAVVIDAAVVLDAAVVIDAPGAPDAAIVIDAEIPDAEPPPDALEIEEPPPPAEAATLKDVQGLIAAGKNAEAVAALNRLRPANPKSAYLPYLLGNLYFDRKWWSEGLDQYRAAIRLNKAYRGRATLVRNSIHALSSDRTFKQARAVLLGDVGAAAAPYLRAAAKSDPSAVVRARAAALVKQLGKKR